MYVLVFYDVDAKRDPKVKRRLMPFLTWRQNSVFEGELSPPKLRELRQRVSEVIKKDRDSVLIYTLPNDKYLDREVMGIDKNPLGNLI